MTTKTPTLLKIDRQYVQDLLESLLKIDSPTGFTDEIVHFMGKELEKLGIPYDLTRRGAIRANLPGAEDMGDRALVTHLDTLGGMVTGLKDNGRLSLTMIGHWSPRFAEGAKVRVYSDAQVHGGTVLPLKASGHTFNEEVDTQPVRWDNLEIRVDEILHNKKDLEAAGFNVGDYVAFDTGYRATDNGYINARHLDNKAGIAAKMGALKAVMDSIQDGGEELPVKCHALFTISEEEGTGASSILTRDVSSMIAIDNSTVAPGQNSIERGVTIAMRDKGGIYDYHLTHYLIDLCQDHKIRHARDVFKHYRSDATSAVEAGSDIRTALICFGLDASHGYERTHLDSLESVGQLLVAYMTSPKHIRRDKDALAPIEGLPLQKETDLDT